MEINELIRSEFKKLGIADSNSRAFIFNGVEELWDRRILLIDDSLEIFKIYIPALLSVTNGKAQFIRYISQNGKDLAAQVVALAPELVLMDGNLGPVQRGWSIVSEIYKLNPELPCVGFSTAFEYEGDFLRSHAVGFICKTVDRPGDTLEEIASGISLWLEK